MDEGLVKIRHAKSAKDFPGLKLEDNEYVEFAFKRTKLCLVAILAGVILSLAVIIVAFSLLLLNKNTLLDNMGINFINIIMVVLIATVLLAGLVGLIVYRGNRLYITNKHVINMIMKSPFATSVNEIDLQSIEDASFRQDGILQKMFHYGTFRLSTVGDETTYTFPYSDASQEDLKAVSKLVSDAKKSKITKEEKED